MQVSNSLKSFTVYPIRIEGMVDQSRIYNLRFTISLRKWQLFLSDSMIHSGYNCIMEMKSPFRYQGYFIHIRRDLALKQANAGRKSMIS